MCIIYHQKNTYLDNPTRGHESIAIVNDWVCALRRLFWQLKLLHTWPVQVPHLTKMIIVRIMKIRRWWGWGCVYEAMIIRMTWLDSFEIIDIAAQFPTEVEIKIFPQIFPLLTNEIILLWWMSQLMPWSWCPRPKLWWTVKSISLSDFCQGAVNNLPDIYVRHKICT